MLETEVGRLRVVPVSDGLAKLPPSYFGNVDWERHQALLGPDGTLDLLIGAFLVHTGEQTVLVDAGVGPLRDDTWLGGELPAALAEAGTGPEDVDLVVCTHLHMDHVGWLVQDGVPFFPRATVRFGAADWDHFVTRRGGAERTWRTMETLDRAGRLDPVSADGEPLAGGVSARLTPGHTPGHMALVLASGNERAYLLGDAVHLPTQIEEPDWVNMYDVDPAMAAAAREALWKELEEGDYPFTAAHFPGLEFGRLLRGQGRRWFAAGLGPR
jgi:glyoxylase-like metal-dependent hydrolase (beta-lactamase superfamily II)